MSSFEDAVIQRIKQLEREVERLQKWERAADLGLGKLSDPNADRVLFWDESAGALKWLTVSTGLALSDTSLALSHLGLQSLTDPGADRVLFWDDSAGALKWLTVEGIVDTDLGKWQAYTPTWTANTTNPSIGNGTLTGRYIQIGKIITCNIYLLVGSTTTFGSGGYGFSLPKTVYSGDVGFVGNFIANDNSANGWYSGQALVVGGDTKIITFIRDGISSYLSYNTPHVWASGDCLFISLTYEVA